MSNQAINKAPSSKPSGMDRFLNFIERAGNKIPDPAILFFWVQTGVRVPLGVRGILPRGTR